MERSLGAALNGPVLGFLRPDGNHVVTGFLDGCDHLGAPALGQMTGKKPAISDDQSERHLAGLAVGHLVIPPWPELHRIKKTHHDQQTAPPDPRRSEERRVGKECRSRWSP